MGIFDDFTPNPDAKAPEYELMAEGTYEFEVESIDGDKAVLKDTKSGKTMWQFFNFDDTEARLQKAFGDFKVGAKAELAVKHSVSKKDDKTYANIVLPFILPAPGSYRVKITKAEMTKTQKGNDMLVLDLLLGDNKNTVKYRWVKPNAASSDMARAMSEVNMNEMLDSFEKIDASKNEPSQWVGAVGGAIVGIENREYDGKMMEFAVVKKWLGVEGQRALPAWGGTATPAEETGTAIEDDCIPDFGL